MHKKVLLISGLDVWSMGAGKGAQSLYKTLTGYADGGWLVYFLTGNNSRDAVSEIHPRVKIIRFDLPWVKKFFSRRIISHLAKNLWWLIFQVVALFIGLKLAWREKFHLFYGYDTLGVPCSYLLAKIFRRPVISRFQGTTIGYFKKQRLWGLKFWDQILALKIPTDLLIMTNDGQEEDKLLKELGVNMARVKFWMNGIKKDYSLPPDFNKEDFKKNLGLRAEDRVILTVNRLHKWKRIDRVIAAMPEIVCHEPRARLVIAGEGEEHRRLVSLAEDLKVNQYVLFAGAAAHHEVPQYQAVADVFVSCNDSANLGNPLLEAMICGSCIVTLNNGSTGELIKNNVTGMLLEMDQTERMGTVIVDLLRDEEKRAFLAGNAKSLAVKSFWTWPERMEEELGLAAGLVQKNNKPVVFMMSSVHRWDDPRIFYKEAETLKGSYQVQIHAVAPFAFREVNGIDVYGLKNYRRLFRCLNWFRLLARALVSRAQVFHFHDPELIPVGVFLRLVKRKRTIVYDVHEHSAFTISTRAWIPSLLRPPAARLVDFTERVTARFFSGLVVADDELARKFKKVRQVEVARNFPQRSFGQAYLQVQPKAELPEGEKPPLVIYVGVLGKDRGLETVLSAMPVVKSKIPEAGCLLVGRVDYRGLSLPFRENMSRILEQGNITLTGQVSYETVMYYIAQSRVGWIPFPPILKHRWGIGTKLIEYMAMGLPVVASDYGEGAEVVRREKCGLLVAPEDPVAHARAICLLLGDREKAARLGRNGREAFQQKYCWEVQGARLLDFYNRLLSGPEVHSLFQEIKEDLARAMAAVAGRNILVKAGRFLQKPGIWAVLGYRLGRRLSLSRCLPARVVLGFYKVLVMLPLKLITGVELHPETKIGSGFYIEHYGNIFIAPTAVIGRNCTVFQGVTIGADFNGHKAARIGDNVIIGAGAKIIGDIVVGSNVWIGANAVVTKSIEDNAVAAGVPAVVIRKR